MTPKELFNQTIVTDFDDNDHVVAGVPSVEGGKNMLWSRFKTVVGSWFKTINGVSIFGSGNIVITGGGGTGEESDPIFEAWLLETPPAYPEDIIDNLNDLTEKSYNSLTDKPTIPSISGLESQSNKDASGGYAGLTLFKINFKNVLNTFTSFFTNSNTASRTYTFPDKDITVAGLDDIFSIPALNNDIYDINAKKIILKNGTSSISADHNSLKRMLLLNFFDPLSLNGCVGWFDFTDSSTITLVSSVISQITDKSGSGNTLTQATAGNRPAYTTYGGSNDYPYATFVAGKSLSKNSLNYPQPFTVFMVIKSNSTNNHGMYLQFNSATNGVHQTVISGAPRTIIGQVSDLNWVGSYPNNYSQYAVYAFTFNGASSKDAYNSIIRNSGNPGTASLVNLSIGSSSCPSFDAHEIIIYNRLLSNTEIANLSDFLIAKYAPTFNTCLLSIGDSITLGSAASGAYENFTQLLSINYNAQTVNLGVNGSTLFTIRPAYKAYINKIPIESYIIIQTGTNESASINTTWRDTYLQFIQILVSYGFNPARICISTPPYTSSRIAAYANMVTYLQYVAGLTGCRYADCLTTTLAGGGDALITDGTHPNSAGHLIMANTIIAALA